MTDIKTYLRVDGEGFVGLANTQQVIDDLLHSKVQPFLQGQTKSTGFNYQWKDTPYSSMWACDLSHKRI